MTTMQKLEDALPPTPESTFERWYRRLTRTFATLVLFVIGLVVLYVAYWNFSSAAAMHQLEKRTPEAKIIGKTQSQIIAAIGVPDDDVKYSGGSESLIYIGPGVCCRIEISNGVATRVVRWSK